MQLLEKLVPAPETLEILEFFHRLEGGRQAEQ